MFTLRSRLCSNAVHYLHIQNSPIIKCELMDTSHTRRTPCWWRSGSGVACWYFFHHDSEKTVWRHWRCFLCPHPLLSCVLHSMLPKCQFCYCYQAHWEHRENSQWDVLAFWACVPVFSHGTDFKYCIWWSRAACTESSLVVDVIAFWLQPTSSPCLIVRLSQWCWK